MYGGNIVKVLLNSFIHCVIFQIKTVLCGAVNLHYLRCCRTDVSPHEYGSLLHTPEHVVLPLMLEGVVGEGPGAGGGAELLAAGPGLARLSPADEEGVQGVGRPGHHHPGQQTRAGGGWAEHLC